MKWKRKKENDCLLPLLNDIAFDSSTWGSFWLCEQLYCHQSDRIMFVSMHILRMNQMKLTFQFWLDLNIISTNGNLLLLHRSLSVSFYHHKSIRSVMYVCIWQALCRSLFYHWCSSTLIAIFVCVLFFSFSSSSSFNNDKFFVISCTHYLPFYW